MFTVGQIVYARKEVWNAGRVLVGYAKVWLRRRHSLSYQIGAIFAFKNGTIIKETFFKWCVKVLPVA